MSGGPAVPRAVIFDMGNVLIDWDPRPVFEPHFAGDEAALEAFMKGPFREMLWHVHDDGGPMADALAGHRDAAGGDSHLVDLFAERWHDFVLGPMPESIAIVEELAARGTGLYGLTNWPAQTWPPRGGGPDYRFLDLFDGIVVSGQVKKRKPDPAIYEHALDVFNLEASEAVFVDDLAENVAVAERLGLSGIRFEHAAGLRRALLRLGLL